MSHIVACRIDGNITIWCPNFKPPYYKDWLSRVDNTQNKGRWNYPPLLVWKVPT